MKKFVHPKSRKAEKIQGQTQREKRIADKKASHRKDMVKNKVMLILSFQAYVKTLKKKSYSYQDLITAAQKYIEMQTPKSTGSDIKYKYALFFQDQLIQQAKNGILQVPDITREEVAKYVEEYDGRIESIPRITMTQVQFDN